MLLLLVRIATISLIAFLGFVVFFVSAHLHLEAVVLIEQWAYHSLLFDWPQVHSSIFLIFSSPTESLSISDSAFVKLSCKDAG